MKQLACAIALHPDGAPLRLALEQGQTLPPMAEFDQHAAPFAARHLFNTLGLETRNAITIGTCPQAVAGSTVHFALCRIAPPVRPQWKHQQPDGTVITGHWEPFDALPDNDVLRWIANTL
ncbi:MAG: hypothetical protein ABJP06_14660 [Sulfitobacter sp.]